MTPELLILAGEEVDNIKMLWPYMTIHEKNALLREYPELLGSAVAAGVIAGISAVSTAIIGAAAAKNRQKREAKNAKEILEQQQSMLETELTAQQAIANASIRRNIILIASAGIAGLIIIKIIKKRKRKKRNT